MSSSETELVNSPEPEVEMSRLDKYRSETIYVIFDRFVDADFEGFHVKGEQHESCLVPRWVATELAKDGSASVQIPINIRNQVKQALAKEEIAGDFELTKMDPMFYVMVKYHAGDLPRQQQHELSSELYQIFRRRIGKIIPLASSSSMTAEIMKLLTPEEQEFYNGINALREKFESRIAYIEIAKDPVPPRPKEEFDDMMVNDDVLY